MKKMYTTNLAKMAVDEVEELQIKECLDITNKGS